MKSLRPIMRISKFRIASGQGQRKCPILRFIARVPLLVVWYALTLGAADAATLTVSKTGADTPTCGPSGQPCLTIQHALDLAGIGDTVLVQAGTYQEGLYTNKAVHLRSDEEAVIQSNWSLDLLGTGPGTIVEGFLFLPPDDLLNTFVFIDITNNAVAEIRRNSFVGNITERAAGAIVVRDTSSALIENNLFSNNTALIAGAIVAGPVPFDEPDPDKQPSLVIINNTFDGNVGLSAAISGGANNPHVLIENNIFTNHAGDRVISGTSPYDPDTAPIEGLNNNLFFGNSAPLYLNLQTVSELNGFGFAQGNIDGDPLYVNAPFGDFHISPGSAAIDSGLATNAPAIDFDGEARPLGAGFEIGFDETDSAGPIPQCADGIDNDDDTLIDLADPGCDDSNDNDETDIPPPTGDVCASPVTSLGGLRVEVEFLLTSQTTKNVLNSNLSKVEKALSKDHNKIARERMMNFIKKVVHRANLRDSNEHRILLNEANNLICGSSNVLIGIPLP